MRPRNFQDILAKLPDARGSGDRRTASCPSPGHKTPTGHLTLKDAGDKALITCQGGKHSYRDFCQAWGFDSLAYSRNSNGPEIVATYDYTDANGELLYQVVRFQPKEFKQRRPDSNGGWLWNLKGIKPVLYRLPEVCKAITEGRTVYICEGEKDADNLAKVGLTATTNSGGAEKWRQEYNPALGGASVVILPDRDAPGQKHAAKAAASLHGKAKSLKVLELPDRNGHQVKDVSDWLATGGTVAELEQLADACPDYEPLEAAVKAKANEVCVPGFISRDGTIGEMIIDASTGERTFVLRTPSGAITRVREYTAGNITYKPMIGVLAGHTVSFAFDATAYDSLGSLLTEVRGFIHRYVELPANFEAIAALYILLSWVYEPLPTLPYLRALGDYGTGKTRFLEVVGAIAFRAIRASGATTPSPIFRIIDIYRGSLVLDEADFNRSDAMAEIVKILNSGYKPGSPVLRSEPTSNKKWEPHSYDVFGPKILATRKRWADKALESRCLTWESEGLTRADIPLVLGPRFRTEAGALCCKLLSFRLDYLPKVMSFNLEDTMPVGNLEPRLQEILLPLKAIARGDTVMESTLDEFVAGMQAELEEDRRNSLPALVLEAMLAIREEGGELSIKAITGRLNEGDLVKDHLDHPERGITARRVGAIIKGLGLRTRQDPTSRRAIVRWDSNRTARLCRRYSFPIPLNNASKASILAEKLRPEASPKGVYASKASPQTDMKSSENEGFEGFEASFPGMKKQGETPPTGTLAVATSGIPCTKGPGNCILRTDASKTFQCNENPRNCQFKLLPLVDKQWGNNDTT